MITKFLENLSYRVNNENALSDITWSLCNVSQVFRETFLKFFFPDMQISPEVEIEREISKDDSRPDFVIYNDDELYIIENKINDHKQHFGQYDKTFKVVPERFGYIANYVIPQPKQGKHYQIRTWEEFYNFEDGKETYEEGFNKLSLDEQIEQIKTFMDEVFDYIYQLKNPKK